MSFLYIGGLFVLGAIFGSFGSVILQRMRHKITWKILKGFAVGRSECPSCHHVLERYDLIPIYSRFRTKGRCSHCKTKISSLYPTLEIVSGLVFVLRGLMYFLPGIQGRGSWHIIMLVSRRLLGLLLVRDIYTYELHVPVWFVLLVVTFLYGIFALIQGFATRDYLLFPLVFFVIFLAVYWLGKLYVKFRFGQNQEGFGQGDVMLAPIIGFLFAVAGFGHGSLIQLIIFFVLGSSLVGIVYYVISALVLRIMKSGKKKQQHSTGTPMIPFLPAMIITYWLMILIGGISFF